MVVINEKQMQISCFYFFRAFACIGVIVHHYLYHILGHHLRIDGIFMQMFFFTSGYLIAMSLLRNSNWKQFAVKRIFRLVPVLWLSIGLVVLSRIGINNEYPHMRHLVFNMFALFLQDETTLIILTTWSLFTELIFYIIAAISYRFAKTIKEVTLMMLLLGFIVHSYNYPSKYVIACSVGSVYFFYKNRQISFVELFISLMCYVYIIVFPEIKYLFKVFDYNTLFYSIGLIFCISIINFYPKIGSGKIIKFFANISYSLYLLHFDFMQLIHNNFLFPVFKNMTYCSIAMLILVSLVLIPICYLVYRYVEKPCYEYGRKIAKRIG